MNTFRDSRESISSVIEMLVDRFLFSNDTPAIRKIGLKLSHLIRGHQYKGIKHVQKTIPDYL